MRRHVTSFFELFGRQYTSLQVMLGFSFHDTLFILLNDWTTGDISWTKLHTVDCFCVCVCVMFFPPLRPLSEKVKLRPKQVELIGRGKGSERCLFESRTKSPWTSVFVTFGLCTEFVFESGLPRSAETWTGEDVCIVEGKTAGEEMLIIFMGNKQKIYLQIDGCIGLQGGHVVGGMIVTLPQMFGKRLVSHGWSRNEKTWRWKALEKKKTVWSWFTSALLLCSVQPQILFFYKISSDFFQVLKDLPSFSLP